VLMGSIAGYFGGWIDTVVSRLTDVTMAFPLLLFIIALASTAGPRLDGITFGIFERGVITLVLILGFFGWYYPARIVRAQVLSLREKEFVEASRSLGASNGRIMFRDILPNLVAPIIVYSSLFIPANILLEAALSFLGVGVQPPRPSWGAMLSDAVSIFSDAWWFMFFPGMALLLTVLAFNLVGDGLQDALNPKSTRST
jgi:peptide/nickel transport system permease protein